jgi:hypothetical protein
MLFEDVIQELSAGPIHHVKDLLETIRAPVVRVRNLGPRAPLGIEFPEEVKSRLASDTLEVSLQMGQVGLVHGHDVVEAVEVLGLDLPGMTGEGHVVSGCASGRPVIGTLSHVPASGSGRVHPEPIREPLLVKDMPKDTFGQGRAADVAEAHKEDGDLQGHV